MNRHGMGGMGGSSTTMDHSMMMTSTASGAMASSTGGMDMDMGGMDHGSMSSCKMQMYWNWFTIDACFLSESWKITSRGMFAGSCIGIICLVIALEFFRRLQREYDRWIVREWKARKTAQSVDDDISKVAAGGGVMAQFAFKPSVYNSTFQPTMLQQLVRALLYAVQLGGAYILMLLVMYYNGYIFFCILIGGLIGYFLFGADNIADGLHQETGSSSCC